MRYALDYVNTAIIKLLETDNSIEFPVGTDIPIYTEVPTGDDSFPYIIISPNSSLENNVTRNSIGESQNINIEVVSKFNQGLGGWGTNNNITGQIVGLIRNKETYLDLSADNFTVINQTIQSIQPIREGYNDSVYFRTIIIVEFDIEDLL
ncbi:MAG: hypothetical protein JKX82_07855 [Oleispira sp.]|nr:hypothetical protein [Oleispira sp.]